MLFADALAFDHPRKTQDGYLVARARASRAGIYEYTGKEIDPEGTTYAADQVVKVYRSEAEVFAQDSVASFLMKPVTNDHPSQPVTAENWRDYAKGVVGKALRDGEYLAFDIVLMDKATIADVEAGKRELSNGYASLVDFTPGETDTGEQYDAVQRQIRGNHVAVVDKGRAGPMCRISDAASCVRLPGADLIELLTDERTYSDGDDPHKTEPARRETSNSQPGSAARQDGDRAVTTKTILRDGFSIEVTDQAEVYIGKLEDRAKELNDKLTASETKVGELTAQVSTKDGEIAALNKKLEDEKVSPQQLEQLAADRSALIAQAKTIHPEIVTDGKSEAEIRKAVVDAKLGDVAKDFNDDTVAGAFKTLAKDVKPVDPVRNVLSGGIATVGDEKAEFEKARAKQIAEMRDAHKPAPAKAA